MNYNRLSSMLAVALLFGCSAGVKGQAGSGGSNGSGGSTTGSGGSSSGGSNGSGGNSSGTGSSSGTVDAAGLDGACAASSVGAQPVPLDLYFLMDSSKSMLETTGAGTSKWAAVSAALDMFFADSGSAGLGVALKYFPDEQSGVAATCEANSDCGSYGPCDFRNTCVGAAQSTTDVTPLCQTNADCGCTTGQTCTTPCSRIYDCGTGKEDDCENGLCCAAGPTAAAGACGSNCTEYAGYCDQRDICSSSDYATPNVPLEILPDTSNALSSSLAGHTPDGETPTGPALTGAISWANQQLANNPDHKAAIVLVTDGLPGGYVPGYPPAACVPADIAGVSAIAMGGATGSPPILTFVVGIFSPGSEAKLAQTNLNMLAMAGGTGNALVISVTDTNVTAELHAALTQAQTKAIACSYTIPPSTSGSGLDFNKVNVQFTSGTGTATTIGHTGSSSACSSGGWYYDVDPAAGTPTQIIACPSTCTQFNTDTSGHVDIVLGCATINVG
jgi:hypothetical protein